MASHHKCFSLETMLTQVGCRKLKLRSFIFLEPYAYLRIVMGKAPFSEGLQIHLSITF